MPSVRVEPHSLSTSLAILAVVFAGCATTSSSKVSTSSGPEQRFSMTGGGRETTALITKDGAQGPQIDLGRYDNGSTLRGKVLNQSFQLSVDEAKGTATGQWGPGPISVNVTDEGDQLKATGLIAGRPSNFTVSHERITGTIGLCAYDLARSGDAYGGSRSCAGGVSPVTVRFPTTILEWKPINIAILMALLMSTP